MIERVRFSKKRGIAGLTVGQINRFLLHTGYFTNVAVIGFKGLAFETWEECFGHCVY